MNRILLYFSLLFLVSCGGSKEDDPKPKIQGCMDELSLNFNAEATQDDGSCVFPVDKLIGTWNVTETGTFFNSTTFQTTTLAPVAYHATVTASDKTEISIETDRATSPVYDYEGPLEVLWAEGELVVTGTTIEGEIKDEDNFVVTYRYGIPASGLYTIKRTYVRTE